MKVKAKVMKKERSKRKQSTVSSKMPYAIRVISSQFSSKVALQMWSAFSRTTWSSRSRVLIELIGEHESVPMVSARTLERRTRRFIEKRMVSSISLRTLAKDMPHIRWAWKALNCAMPTSLSTSLSTLQRGCHKEPHKVSKALPMTREVLMTLARRLVKTDLPLLLVLLLAFETASRIDDIFKLRSEMAFLSGRAGAMLVLWGASKANPTAEARADHQQIVDDPGPLRALLKRPQLIQQVTPAQVTKLFKQIKVSKAYRKQWQQRNPTVVVRDHFTLHSLKRGRGDELWRAAADGKLQLQEVLHRMKHKSVEAALAYAPDPVLAAEAVRRNNSSSSNSRLPTRRAVPRAE